MTQGPISASIETTEVVIQASVSLGNSSGGISDDDPRLSDSREWTATTISQVEAEAGTSVTRRAWTAQRVRQAITAWWTGASTAAGRAIVEAANTAAQRTALGLGNVNNTSDADKPISAATAAALAAFNTRLDQFRDARTFCVSKRIAASDSNNGTSPGEPFLTIGAAVAAANAFRVANPGEFAAIEIGPGTYVEAALPMRLRPNILVRSLKQRSVRIKPAAGQELNSFFAVDSGNMICDITLAGHQAENTSPTDSTVGTRAWAIQFNEQANGGLGPILTASPYIKDCLSLTAEDDAGEAGSTSTGDCGGGVEVDGAKVHPSSPIRSMVVYGFTQQNLGGPGAVIKNDGYAELVSFFGLFGTWHVRCETGGQATMSGGGCSEFGIYGLMADGYSPTALFTGSLRVAALEAALEVDVVSMTANRLGTKSRPASGQVMLLGGSGYVVQSSTPINASGVPVAEGAVGQAGYRVAFFNPSGLGLAANVAQGATADFRLRSQISAGCHSANYVGSGTNYNALPWNGGVPVRANEVVETNFGRVFGLIVNDVGDLRTPGNAFKVDGTTGSVTISTDEFDLSGLNAIGPFSRNGGLSTVGVQLQEVSNSTSLIASTGAPDGNTAPTQVAVKTYADNRFLQNVTFTAGLPLTISDTSTQDGQGYWTRTRNITLSLNEANGLARLDSSGLIPASILPSYVDDVLEFAGLTAFPATGQSGKIYVALDQNKTYRWSGSLYIEISPSPGSTDAVTEGATNLYFTQARARQSISVPGSNGLAYDSGTGVFTFTLPNTAVTPGSYTYADITVDAQGRIIAASSGTPVNVGTDLSYTASSRLLASSTGSDVTLPEATTTDAGLQSAADKTKLDSIVVDSATLVRKFVRNNSGVSIPKGAPVYATGSSGTTLTVALADASVEATSSQTLGLAQQTIGINANGYVVAVGLMDGISTATLTEGQIVWLSETAGQLTTTRPTQPAHGVVCGYCVKQGAGASGILYVKVDNGQELNELHDVLISGVSEGQVLRRASDGLWKNHTPVAADISDSTAPGLALLTAANADAQRTALGLGTLATQSGTFSGASSGTNTGDVTLATSLADILSLAGQELSADDPGGDRLLFWDDSEGKLTHASVGPGIVFDGTTLRAEDNPWMALGDEPTAATSGVKLTVRHWPQSHRLTAVPLWSASAPVGSALQIDIRIGGTSIFSTLPTIAVGGVSSTTTTAAVFSTAFVSGGQTIPAGSTVTFHVTQQPSGGGGAGLKVLMPAVRV